MNTAVELPALDGRDPLGFLAALGLLRIIRGEQCTNVGLSFSDTAGTATLHSPLTSIDEIASELNTVIARAAGDTAIVGVDARFPLRKSGSGPDPMRVPRHEFPRLVERVSALGHEAGEWLSVLVTDLAVDRQGRVALTPFTAPSGQQSLRTFFTTSLQFVRKEPCLLKEALEGWRRVDGFTGEYLDHRVIRDAADHPSGKSVEAGVPGATWLATMALPLLRLTGDGTRPNATLWHSDARRSVMLWPLWRQTLDQHAVRILLQHAAVRPIAIDPLRVNKERLRPLGVFEVCGAERQHEGRKSAGVLAPVTVFGD
jgi:hypothetical protein